MNLLLYLVVQYLTRRWETWVSSSNDSTKPCSVFEVTTLSTISFKNPLLWSVLISFLNAILPLLCLHFLWKLKFLHLLICWFNPIPLNFLDCLKRVFKNSRKSQQKPISFHINIQKNIEIESLQFVSFFKQSLWF